MINRFKEMERPVNILLSLFITAILVLMVLGLGSPAQAGADPRSMVINRLPELGLEIWTEAVPAWHTRIEQHKGRPVFIAKTPLNYYPPASMSWTTLRFDLGTDEELVALVDSALAKAKKHYQVPATTPVKIDSAVYGPLKGFEGQFRGHNEGDVVDVHFFVGQQAGKPAVVMQALTLPDKLPHLRYQIERSWHYLKYINWEENP